MCAVRVPDHCPENARSVARPALARQRLLEFADPKADTPVVTETSSGPLRSQRTPSPGRWFSESTSGTTRLSALAPTLVPTPGPKLVPTSVPTPVPTPGPMLVPTPVLEPEYR